MRRLIAFIAVFCVGAGFAWGADPEFKKIRLTNDFVSEGATYGDFNKDGHTDVAAGPYWYEGPDFSKRHEFMPARTWNPAHEYSNAFLMFTGDFNHDGWTDILVVGFPTQDARWYENPQGKDGHWTEHPIISTHLDNESPVLVDLFQDGHPVLLSNVNGPVGYLTPDPSDVNKPWIFHAISGDVGMKSFTHGIGVGDINGDGRLDILMHNGWWEQPEKVEEGKHWTFHPFMFGPAAAQMFAYDVDGDGKNDVITSIHAHGYGIAWFKQLPDGKFEKHLIVGTPTEPGAAGIVFSQPHALAFADIDGDGTPDLICGKRRFAHGDHGDEDPLADPVTYWIKLEKGPQPKWTAHLLDKQTGVGTQVVAADLNDDGKTDVLVGNKMGTTIFLQMAAGAAAAAGDNPPADHASRKLLVFSMTKAFHHSSIPLGQKVVSELGAQSKEFTAVVSEDLSNFDPDKIKEFAGVCFLNTTGEIPFSDEQKKGLLDFVSSGHAFIGIHSATDTLYQWPEYGDIIGGHFDGHPWTADMTETLRVEEKNPITAPFPSDFPITEEIYQMKAPYDREKCDVLISLDTAKTGMNRSGIHRTDGDFPVCWIKSYGDKGRVFYTSLGHNETVWERADYQQHLLAGIRWALGDYDLPIKPHPLPSEEK